MKYRAKVLGLILLFLVCAAGVAAAKDQKPPKGTAAKAERELDEIKRYAAEKLSRNDLDFKDAVDKEFNEAQQQHGQEAFETNIAPPARPTVVQDGDRLRLETGLYNNKVVQDYVNRIGQQLVPSGSSKLYAFRLVSHPVPFANTLSTGTIYVSTGLVSLLDNEAHLAYILAHEMAHVEQDHWRSKSVMNVAIEFKKREDESKKGRYDFLKNMVPGLASYNAFAAISGEASTAATAVARVRQQGLNLDWDLDQESEADAIAFRVLLDRSYDVRTIPALYAAIQGAVQRDQRVGVGFIGSRERISARLDYVNKLIEGKVKPETYKKALDDKLSSGKLIGSGPDFNMMMSELKRDNGIMAFYHDMFDVAKSNLVYAVDVRSNDPAAHYYLGKVLKVVGRSAEDKKRADDEFLAAIKTDRRRRFYGAYLYRALLLMELKDPKVKPEIVESFQNYLNGYLGYTSEEALTANYLPPNLDDLYDYVEQSGEIPWPPKIPKETADRIKEFSTQVLKPGGEADVSKAAGTNEVIPGSPDAGAVPGRTENPASSTPGQLTRPKDRATSPSPKPKSAGAKVK